MISQKKLKFAQYFSLFEFEFISIIFMTYRNVKRIFSL